MEHHIYYQARNPRISSRHPTFNLSTPFSVTQNDKEKEYKTHSFHELYDSQVPK